MEKNIRVLIAASGTGGHLFPALHIARALVKEGEQSGSHNQGEKFSLNVEFIGSGRPLEERLIDGNGFRRHVINIVGVKRRGLKGWLEFALLLPGAALKVWRLLGSYRPHVVIGVGGYVSVLPVVMARLRGIFTWIHECELKPGLANALLAWFANRISVSFEQAKVPCTWKVVYTGMPVREGLKEIREKGITVQRPSKLLVVGGSQGAKALDDAFWCLAPWLKEEGIEVWHQCRQENVDTVMSRYYSCGVACRVEGFIDNPVEAYDWAHIVLCRAGASSVMEVGVINKPAIFVPYPFAQGGHQKANAMTLVSQGKALLVEEGGDDFVPRLKDALSTLLNPANYQAMLATPHAERSTAAASLIASTITHHLVPGTNL